MSETRKRFLFGSLSAYMVDLVGAVATFVCGILIARTLGPTLQGRYALLILLPLITSRFLSLGLGPGTVHGVAREPDSAPVRSANAILASLFLGGIGAGIALLIADRSALEELQIMQTLGTSLLGLAVPALLFSNYSRSISVGLDRTWRRNLMVLINPVARLALLAGFVLVLDLSIKGAFTAWVLAIVAEALLGFAFIAGPMWKTRSRPNLKILLEDLRFGIQVHAAAVIGLMLLRFDQFLVAYFMDSTAVGHYASAVTLVMPLSLLPQAIRAAFLPKVTARYKKIGSSERMTPIVTRVLFAFTGIFALICAFVAGPAIRLLYGEIYEPSVLPFMILLPGVTLVATITVLNSSLQARRGQRWTLLAAAIGLVVNIGLDLVFIPAFGIAGAALASTLAYFCSACLVVFFFLRLVPELTVRELLIIRLDDLREIYQGFRH